MSWIFTGRTFALSVLALCLFSAAGARASTPLDPEWNGRSLGEWVQLYQGPIRASLGKGPDLLFAEESEMTVQQIRAAQAIRAIGTNALPIIFEWLRTDRVQDACSGFEALNELAHSAVPQLVSWLEGDDPASRDKAILALGRIGPAASAAESSLLRELRNGNINAVTAVGQMRLKSPEVVEALVRHLNSKTFDGKECWFEMQVAIALGNIGPAAVKGTIPLTETLEKIEAIIQQGGGKFQLALLAQRTIEALGKIGDERALATLNRLLVEKKNPGNLTNLALRRTLMRTLANFGSSAKEALPVLLEILASPHTDSRDKAIATEAIMRINMQAL